MHPVSLILYNIRSAHNVGSLFRTADAVGVTHLYLVGYTPDPIDRFDRVRSDIKKTALGAEEVVSWEHRDSLFELLKELDEQDISIVALEQHDQSVEYTSYQLEGPTALIVGNEPDGIEEEVLEWCDAILEIPMRGQKESLNVSVAAGIGLYQLMRA